MVKKTVIRLLLVLLFALGGVWVLNRYIQNSNQSLPFQRKTTGSFNSLKSVLSSGSSQTCTFSNPNDLTNKGTVFTSNGKVRTDFTTTTNNQFLSSHMIIENNTSYIWTDGQKSGYKTQFDPSSVTPENLEEETPTSVIESFDLGTELNYDCKSWVVDNSVFNLPKDIQFTDLSAQISSQCATCNNLTGDQKTQCLAALKCN